MFFITGRFGLEICGVGEPAGVSNLFFLSCYIRCCGFLRLTCGVIVSVRHCLLPVLLRSPSGSRSKSAIFCDGLSVGLPTVLSLSRRTPMFYIPGCQNVCVIDGFTSAFFYFFRREDSVRLSQRRNLCFRLASALTFLYLCRYSKKKI